MRGGGPFALDGESIAYVFHINDGTQTQWVPYGPGLITAGPQLRVVAP